MNILIKWIKKKIFWVVKKLDEKLNVILKLKEIKNKESSLLGVNNFKTNIVLTIIFLIKNLIILN